MRPVLVLALVAVVSLDVADARSRPGPTSPMFSTLEGTNVKVADTARRTGSADVQQQVQAVVRGGGTADLQGTRAATREAGRASQSTRTAVGSSAASAAVQRATRTNNAFAGTAAGAGIAAVTAQGRGVTVSNPAVRSSAAAKSTQSAIQAAARGAVPARAATNTGQFEAQATQVRTSFAGVGGGIRGH